MVVFPLILLLVLFLLNIPVAFCLMVSALAYFVLYPTGAHDIRCGVLPHAGDSVLHPVGNDHDVFRHCLPPYEFL